MKNKVLTSSKHATHMMDKVKFVNKVKFSHFIFICTFRRRRRRRRTYFI